MPEVEIEINTETGESETRIKGIPGAACEKTAEAIKNVFGTPSRDEKTIEYNRAAPHTQRQIKSK